MCACEHAYARARHACVCVCVCVNTIISACLIWLNFKNIKTNILDVSWPIWPRSRSTGFKQAQDHYMINTLFMFEGKIPNDSKDEDDDDDGTK